MNIKTFLVGQEILKEYQRYPGYEYHSLSYRREHYTAVKFYKISKNFPLQ